MAARSFRWLWAFINQASTIAWLWSVGGGTVASVILRQLTSLPLGWLVLFGVGFSCLILAAIATFVPLGRPRTEIAAPAPCGSGFDSSKWAVTFGGSLVRSDYDAGHEVDVKAKHVLLWLRPPKGEPVDPELSCEVGTPEGETYRSPAVDQIGGPTAPGTARHNGVPNADYLIEYPSDSGASAQWIAARSPRRDGRRSRMRPE